VILCCLAGGAPSDAPVLISAGFQQVREGGEGHRVGVGCFDIVAGQAADLAASIRAWNLWNSWVMPGESVGRPLLP